MQTPFETTPAIPAVEKVIHTEGCMPAIRRALLSDVLPLLLACALLSLVVALIELLLVLASCCFADHVKKIKDLKSKPHLQSPAKECSPRHIKNSDCS